MTTKEFFVEKRNCLFFLDSVYRIDERIIMSENVVYLKTTICSLQN